MRLGFHYHVPAMRGDDGTILVPGHLGLFLDQLAVHCSQLVCFLHSPRASEIPFIDYTLSAENIEWVDLGSRYSVPVRTLLAAKITRSIRDRVASLDAFLIRGPSPLLPAVARAARPLPTVLLLVGDYVAGVDGLAQPHWRKELIRMWSRWNQSQEREIARSALTLVNSPKLYAELKPVAREVVEVRTTTLSEKDFYYRVDTCENHPVRLLYTGRIELGKGLLEMVEAVAWLVERGEDVLLDLVGWPQDGDPAVNALEERAKLLGIGERVIYHGYKPVGPELFEYYRAADIYLIASRNSEGFPRTIWEALAHGLPVVATTVGSIPLLLEDGVTATLVPPRDSVALAGAILSLLHDSSLRRQLIKNGRLLALENTLDKRVAEIATQLKYWISNERNLPVT